MYIEEGESFAWMNKVGGGGLRSKWNRPELVRVDSQLIEINRTAVRIRHTDLQRCISYLSLTRAAVLKVVQYFEYQSTSVLWISTKYSRTQKYGHSCTQNIDTKIVLDKYTGIWKYSDTSKKYLRLPKYLQCIQEYTRVFLEYSTYTL